VKIRGTPAHIAEKYLSLARDAQSSGDPVLAENYLQHAEHYNRIIMAYREQLGQPGDLANGNGQRMRGPADLGDGDEFGDEEGEDMLDDGFQPPAFAHPQPQPRQPEGRQQAPFEGGRHDRPFRRDQGRFRDRDRDRGDRGDRGDRDRHHGERPPPQPQLQPERQPERQAEATDAGEPRRRDRFQQAHEQPEFLRRPVRRVRSDSDEGAPPPAKEESSRD
jgi:hypothetical protein